jgi:hypothetical protein
MLIYIRLEKISGTSLVGRLLPMDLSFLLSFLGLLDRGLSFYAIINRGVMT